MMIAKTKEVIMPDKIRKIKERQLFDWLEAGKISKGEFYKLLNQLKGGK